MIEAEINRKINAKKLLSSLISDKADFETLDTNHYWNVINEKESNGEEFINIEDIYGYRAISLLREVKCPHCGKNFEVDLEDYIYDECSYENGMGLDLVYSFDSDECQKCCECFKPVRITGWVREYPMGAFDSEEVNIEVIEKEEN